MSDGPPVMIAMLTLPPMTIPATMASTLRTRLGTGRSPWKPGGMRRNGCNDERNGDDVSHRSTRCVSVARATSENLTKHSGAAFRRDDPGPIGPWGIVANVLVVTAFQLCHPMMLFVLAEANDPSVHGAQGRSWRARSGLDPQHMAHANSTNIEPDSEDCVRHETAQPGLHGPWRLCRGNAESE